jgi:hypothetical protein
MRPGDGTFVLRWNNHQESMRKDRKLLFSVACSDPVSGAFLTPGFGSWIRDGKESRAGIPEEHPGSYLGELSISFWVKNTIKKFDADPESGILSTLDPGWKKIGSGIKVRIRNTALCSYLKCCNGFSNSVSSM